MHYSHLEVEMFIGGQASIKFQSNYIPGSWDSATD